MIIHIARDGRSLGRFTAEEIAEGLRDGRILLSDLAWHEELTGWIPVSQLEGLPEAPNFAAEPAPPVAPALPIEPAWERRDSLGFFPALWETVTGVLGQPGRTFSAMDPEGSIRKSLGFLALVGTVSTWIAMGFQYAIYKINPATFGPQTKEIPPGFMDAIFGAMLLFAPVWILLGAALASGLMYGFLRLVANQPVSFRAVLRVYSYSWGASSLLQALPMCGGYLYPIVGIWICSVGLARTLRIPVGLAVAAVILPALLCCGAFAAMLAVALSAPALSS